jgi:superfamily I DNA/RNA helicase
MILSIKTSYKGYIDFNDQVYMPALFGGTYPSFPTVLIDEKQDLNPVNHRMIDKLVKGRLIGCGDPWQSIYGFRGAVQDGMAKLKQKFDMKEFDLSVSFRCPRAIVENARWRVPHYKWRKEGGSVTKLQQLNGIDIPEHAAIICRNNAPLFRLAFDLLSHGRSVSVAGSDIGPRLIATLKKLGDDSLPRSSVLGEIELWLEDKLRKGSSTAPDMAEAMRVFAGYGETLGQAVSYAEYLFQQRGAIHLLTGHKAKGLEFDVVYFLDPALIKGENDQELNLRYVIQTRAKDKLYEIDSANIIWGD